MGNSGGSIQAAQSLELQANGFQDQLGEELASLEEEIVPTLIVLGNSTSPDAAFQNSALKGFATNLQISTGITVQILGQNE